MFKVVYVASDRVSRLRNKYLQSFIINFYFYFTFYRHLVSVPVRFFLVFHGGQTRSVLSAKTTVVMIYDARWLDGAVYFFQVFEAWVLSLRKYSSSQFFRLSLPTP